MNQQNKSNIISHLIGDETGRYCRFCHVRCIQKSNPEDILVDTNTTTVYQCPQCGIRVNIVDTEPGENLHVNFPAYSPFKATTPPLVQNKLDSLPRAEYFYLKRKAQSRESDSDGYKDPYMKSLRARHDILITQIDYYDPIE